MLDVPQTQQIFLRYHRLQGGNLFLWASLWLTERDVIRCSKAFEAGRSGVSQQFYRLCPHSLNFMVGWDERKAERVQREVRARGQSHYQWILNVKRPEVNSSLGKWLNLSACVKAMTYQCANKDFTVMGFFFKVKAEMRTPFLNY